MSGRLARRRCLWTTVRVGWRIENTPTDSEASFSKRLNLCIYEVLNSTDTNKVQKITFYSSYPMVTRRIQLWPPRPKSHMIGLIALHLLTTEHNLARNTLTFQGPCNGSTCSMTFKYAFKTKFKCKKQPSRLSSPDSMGKARVLLSRFPFKGFLHFSLNSFWLNPLRYRREMFLPWVKTHVIITILSCLNVLRSINEDIYFLIKWA